MRTRQFWREATLAAGIVLAAPSAFANSLVESSLRNSSLGQYYAHLQAQLLSAGRLRTDARPYDAPITASGLTNNFAEIAMRHEYGGSGAKPLVRWETPVAYSVTFGASVGQSQRISDHTVIAETFATIAHATGHPVHAARGAANFQVLVVGQSDLPGVADHLKRTAPELSRSDLMAIKRMPRNHLCKVIAVPHGDLRQGYRRVVAIIRAEHAPRMRASCIAEELAQGMGLPNDCESARPSIFNDDEEFAVLTDHDKMLLRILYSGHLRSGMRRNEVVPIVSALSSRLAH
ncbi:DUF2927 domain-containing protein [Aestuariibius sp. 2305UL40-4]|uniref:DUF2927 domain-containing protein n=1 Tax=Aestuariibius violaceus TaxID=3234132 RepID=UPI00345E0B04